MGIAERKARIRERTRKRIIDTAMNIVKRDGWESLTMRKIAENIDYTAPMIYEYFKNKEGILLEIGNLGFLRLKIEMLKADQLEDSPQTTLKKMWKAYWEFAFADSGLYQLMFAIRFRNEEKEIRPKGVEIIGDVVKPVIRRLIVQERLFEADVEQKFYACWASIHGLINLNFIQMGPDNDVNMYILTSVLKNSF